MRYLKRFNESITGEDLNDINEAVNMFVRANIDDVVRIPDIEESCLRYRDGVRFIEHSDQYNNCYLLDMSGVNIDKYIIELEDFISSHLDENYLIKPVGEMGLTWNIPKNKFIIASKKVFDWLHCLGLVVDSFKSLSLDGAYASLGKLSRAFELSKIKSKNNNVKKTSRYVCLRKWDRYRSSDYVGRFYPYENVTDTYNINRFELIIKKGASYTEDWDLDDIRESDKRIWIDLTTYTDRIKIENNAGIDPIYIKYPLERSITDQLSIIIEKISRMI